MFRRDFKEVYPDVAKAVNQFFEVNEGENLLFKQTKRVRGIPVELPSGEFETQMEYCKWIFKTKPFCEPCQEYGEQAVLGIFRLFKRALAEFKIKKGPPIQRLDKSLKFKGERTRG